MVGWVSPGGYSWKKWEPRNPVPGPLSVKIRKVDENSESKPKSPLAPMSILAHPLEFSFLMEL